MTDDIRKRFIAGAVCPKCQALDKIVAWRQDDADFRECVECGFSDEMRFKNAQSELRTRVNQTGSEKPTAVKILDFPTAEKK